MEPQNAWEVGYNAVVRRSPRMTALGISSIVIGIALICAGLIFWPRAPRGLIR
jgi:hypothetical protein